MSTGRVHRARVTSVTEVRGRIHRARLTAPPVPHGRVHRALLSGAAAVAVTPPAPVTIGPGEQAVLTAGLVWGGVASSWTWRRISGPSATLSGTGASRTITGPSVVPTSASTSQVITLGITATVAGTTSPEVTVSITVLAQAEWLLDTSTSPARWVGAAIAPA